MSQPRVIAKTEAETMLERQFSALASQDSDRVAAFAAFAKTRTADAAQRSLALHRPARRDEDGGAAGAKTRRSAA